MVLSQTQAPLQLAMAALRDRPHPVTDALPAPATRRKRKAVLEISGTEVVDALGRRHRAKVAQARDNPFGWDAYVVVSAFSTTGHRIRFSRHSFEENLHGKSEAQTGADAG